MLFSKSKIIVVESKHATNKSFAARLAEGTQSAVVLQLANMCIDQILFSF
jgi:hypothetical protein